MIFRLPDNFDSKFRFILVAAERAKQLQNGAPRKIDIDSPKPAHVAIHEVQRGLISFKILEDDEQE